MSFDFRSVEPKPSDWFEPAIEYRGEGVAEFTDLPGSVTGPAAVIFDDSGQKCAQLDGDLRCDLGLQSGIAGLMQFFTAAQGGPTRRVEISGDDKWNSCSRLTVRTPQGLLVAEDEVSYSYRLPGADGRETQLSFHLLRSDFRTDTSAPAKYWVMPLCNFVSDFRQSAPPLDRHPLRIHPTPIIPGGLSGEGQAKAEVLANSKNRLIVCRFQGTPAFVEPLPDYREREESLKAGAHGQVITAVMVGEVGANSVESDEVASWFPFDFVWLLTLASGSRVGAPWIEFRDADGDLVRRVHWGPQAPHFRPAHAVIDERLHRGTGKLLTEAQSSPLFGTARLRVALRHLWEGRAYSEDPLEELLGHACRGLECICAWRGLIRENLLEALDEPYDRTVVDALGEAEAKITSAAKEASLAGNRDQAKLLRNVAERTTSNPAYVDWNFGRAIIRLLDSYGLPDAGIMARQLADEVDEGRRLWAQWLSKCRGVPMHGNYFDIEGGKHDPDRLIATNQHLLDILLRVLLKALGYTGTYQPAVSRGLALAPLDWVQPDMTATDLGYQGPDSPTGTDAQP